MNEESNEIVRALEEITESLNSQSKVLEGISGYLQTLAEKPTTSAPSFRRGSRDGRDGRDSRPPRRDFSSKRFDNRFDNNRRGRN